MCSFDVTDVGSELPVAKLTWCVGNLVAKEGSSKGLMVGGLMETTVFSVIAETLDGLEDGKRFPFVSTVPGFWLGELTREGNRLPVLSTRCCMTAPVPVPEASVAIAISASWEGKDSMTVSLRAFLVARKVASAPGVQTRVIAWLRLRGFTMA